RAPPVCPREDPRKMAPPAVGCDEAVVARLVQYGIRFLARNGHFLNEPQRVELEYRDGVAVAIAGESPRQCRGERDAVHSRGMRDASDRFAADRLDDVDTVATADEQARAARFQRQVVPTAAP